MFPAPAGIILNRMDLIQGLRVYLFQTLMQRPAVVGRCLLEQAPNMGIFAVNLTHLPTAIGGAGTFIPFTVRQQPKKLRTP